MTTDVEESVEFTSPGQHITQLDRVLPQILAVLEEVGADGVVLEHLDGAGVEWGLASLGRGNDQLGLVFQDMVGVGEFGLSLLECV